jgi:large subunit ribosomal protein L24e
LTCIHLCHREIKERIKKTKDEKKAKKVETGKGASKGLGKPQVARATPAPKPKGGAGGKR